MESEPPDEAALIEQRRKKREAIKAKHRSQETPLLVQALNANNTSTSGEAQPDTPGTAAQAIGKLKLSDCFRVTNVIQIRSTSPHHKLQRKDPPPTPRPVSSLAKTHPLLMAQLKQMAIYKKTGRPLPITILPWTCKKTSFDMIQNITAKRSRPGLTTRPRTTIRTFSYPMPLWINRR